MYQSCNISRALFVLPLPALLRTALLVFFERSLIRHRRPSPRSPFLDISFHTRVDLPCIRKCPSLRRNGSLLLFEKKMRNIRRETSILTTWFAYLPVLGKFKRSHSCPPEWAAVNGRQGQPTDGVSEFFGNFRCESTPAF